MGVKLGIVMDPIQHIHVDKDSTVALMRLAQAREYSLYYMTPQDLMIRDGITYGRMAPIRVSDQDDKHWCTLSEASLQPLNDLDCILMRKDPPFDMAYIYCTYLLESAQREGVMVLNRPESLRDCNEKYFTTRFPELCPPTLIASDKAEIQTFLEAYPECIMKPLDGMGGKDIFRMKPGAEHFDTALNTLTHAGRVPCVVQRYIPEITEGDKRVLMVMGEPVDTMVARIPHPNDFRGNVSAGASIKLMPLGARERAIAQTLAPTLVAKGLWFVGIDIIGDYLTEINVTSPTCIREIESGSSTKVCEPLLDTLEAFLK